MSQGIAHTIERFTQLLSVATSTVLGFVVIFGAIVLFHEFGHFSAAKLAGIRVFEFAVGVGPKLWQRQKGQTLYSVRAVPLGGFVKIAGMDATPEPYEAEVPFNETFEAKPLWQRLVFMFAGAFMNFFLAFLLIVIYHMTVTIPPTIQEVDADSPAALAGLQPGDQILSIDEQATLTAEQVVRLVQPSAGSTLSLSVQRSDQLLTLKVVPNLDHERQVGVIGVTLFDQQRQPLLTSLRLGVIETYSWTRGIARAVGRMVLRRTPAELSGPVGIFVVTGSAIQQGLGSLLRLAILLNINLGLFNLFPIPALDGFWVVLLIFEALRGTPLKPEQRGMMQFVGFALLLLLLVYATYQDVARFFLGI
ncbi:MAG: M50 family metallopeptidase [Limnochordia bacterium]